MPDRQSTRRRFLAAVGSVALVGIAGCRSAGEEPQDDTAWEDVDELYFEGRIEAWTGVEPAIIAGEDNPTLVLFEGEAYDFRWVNKDGAIHTLEIWDENDDIVGEYATESVDKEGEEAVLTNVVASPDMATYVCRYHRTTQVGEIEVRSL